MRETYFFKSKKIAVVEFEEAHKKVCERYDGAIVFGSCCHWTWYSKDDKNFDNPIAEMWPKRGCNDDWWLKLKELS